ncbi:MAG: hypothetical protein J5829_09055 [Lachnospiraceae bacterium]|nr:hypothetical protein [Lachnospiraceae bacterium]
MTLRDEIFEEIRNDYRINGKDSFLYRYLRKGKMKEKCEEEPAKEGTLIHKSATDLMYNLGYPLAKKSSAGQRNGAGSGTRTHNTALDLIDAWYAERGEFLTGGSRRKINEKELQDLFVVLNRNRKSKAFVPVEIDGLTGAGLYILGRDLYPENTFPYDGNHYCGFCIISDWIYATKEEGITLNYGNLFNQSLGACENVHDAVVFFETSLKEDKADYLYEIQNLNGDMPKGCPESQRFYFTGSDDGDDFDRITDEDRREAMEDFGC